LKPAKRNFRDLARRRMNGTDQTLSEIRQSLLEPNQTATLTLPQERSESNRVKAQSPVICLVDIKEIKINDKHFHLDRKSISS
jgi:hypothetical protein